MCSYPFRLNFIYLLCTVAPSLYVEVPFDITDKVHELELYAGISG